MSFTPPGRALTERPPRRLIYLFSAIAVVIVVGALGFHLIEGWSLTDSLYVAVQTVTTVGYGDVAPVTQRGRVYATFLMLTGVGTVLYALTTVVQSIVQSEMLVTLGMRRRYRKMRKLEDHFIICGAGRIGARIIREMQRANVRFVVIEKDRQKVAQLVEDGTHVLVRDATLEESLLEAGVDHAHGLATCLPDDADNLYVVLTARGLNPSLHIVARAVEEQAEPKLIRAGANRVVAPTIIGSHRMAQALIKPAVADFMDSIAAESLDLGFEQIEISTSSVYVGKKLRDTNIRSEMNAVVVAIRRGKDVIYHPTGEAIIQAHDLLIVIGRAETLGRMAKFARGEN